MRRHFLWFGIAFAWALAALIGCLRHHTAQALPAAIFSVIFLCIGLWIGKRDAALRRARLPKIR